MGGFCGGALRVGRYKLIVGYPGWDVHAPISTSNITAHVGILHWDLCADHCLFDMENDPEENHDLSNVLTDVAGKVLQRFWELSNTTGIPPDTHGFDKATQCPVATKTRFWLPADDESLDIQRSIFE